MHRARFLPVPISLLLAVLAAGSVPTPGPAQTVSPAPGVPGAPYSPAVPPPPPDDAGLFPSPNAGRPAPPASPDPGELRQSSAAGGQRGKRANSRRSGGPGGERRRRDANPTLTAAAGDPVEIRIAYRRAETEAKRDPAFGDLLRRADESHDDEERRALLRSYYTGLFAQVRRIDRSPALAAHVAVLSRAAEQRYAPRRRAGGADEREAGRDRAGRR